MKNFFIKTFMLFNAWLLRLSRGRLGGQLGTQRILILHTTGRKSGQDRAIPIAYFEHDGRYLVVGSNWGRDQQAAWYLNLKHDPLARLEIKDQMIVVTAHEAQGEEYQRWWQFVTQRHPPYERYQTMTTRHLPIMVFEPVNYSS